MNNTQTNIKIENTDSNTIGNTEATAYTNVTNTENGRVTNEYTNSGYKTINIGNSISEYSTETTEHTNNEEFIAETAGHTDNEGSITETIEHTNNEAAIVETAEYTNGEGSTIETTEHTNIHTNSHEVASKAHYDTIKTEKSSVAELQKIVQKLEKLEKMINPNSKKSLILWEEDNSFKNLISSIVSYATTCDTTEFPIELLDRLKALGTDVDNQIAEGTVKVEKLTKQAKINTELSEVLSTVYIAAMAGTPIEEYENKIQNPEISCYREHLVTISTAIPESEEYLKAEKAVKSKITNLENSVHITIDLERTTSKGGALQYIKTEVTPAIERLQAAYDEQYKANEVTEISGEEAITALAVRKTFTEKVYDTFVRPFANLFKRKSKVK